MYYQSLQKHRRKILTHVKNTNETMYVLASFPDFVLIVFVRGHITHLHTCCANTLLILFQSASVKIVHMHCTY